MNLSAKRPGLAATLLAAALVSAPVQAGWKYIPANAAVQVRDASITPIGEWNQASAKPGKEGVSWTKDGFELNGFDMFAGVAHGRSLYKERDRKNNPMPKFDSTMLLPDLADFFERSFRAQYGLTDFAVEESQQASFGGGQGLQVRCRYTLPNDELVRRGIARLAVRNQKLYVANFYAPQIYYFEAGLPEAKALMDRARF